MSPRSSRLGRFSALVGFACFVAAGCGGGVPVDDVERHLAAGRLERASELVAGHEGSVAADLRARIARRAEARQGQLARLAELELTRDSREPSAVLDDIKAVLAAAEDPVVREQAEVCLSAAHDWAALRRQRERDQESFNAREEERRSEAERIARRSRPQPQRSEPDPVAAAALSEFDGYVRASDWRRALALATEWATAQGAEATVREAFADWRAAAELKAKAEADVLVLRASQLEREGRTDDAIALLAGAADRFPDEGAAGAVGRTLDEMRIRADAVASAAEERSGAGEDGAREAAPEALAQASPEVPRGPTDEELASLKRAEDARKALLRREFEAAGERLASSPLAAVRDAAYAELVAAGARSPAARAVLADALEERWKGALARIESSGVVRKLERLAAHRVEVDAAREAALALIFDEVEYFYPYGPPDVTSEQAAKYEPVQREVDERVAALERAWKAQPTVKLSESVRAAVADLGWLQRRAAHAKGRFVFPAGMPPWIEGLPHDLAAVDGRSFAWTREGAAALAYDRAVARRNEALWAELEREGATDAPSSPDPAKATYSGYASKLERDQVRLTNEYRAMFGRRALAWNRVLQRAAEGHSSYMEATGTFGHFETAPGRRTPFDRMRLLGYGKGVSENCHMGSGDAAEAHRGWIRSSGHHRNLLMLGHKEMASAVAGGYWTQDFGLDTAFEAHLDLTGWLD